MGQLRPGTLCDVQGCPRDADYEGWMRNRGPFDRGYVMGWQDKANNVQGALEDPDDGE